MTTDEKPVHTEIRRVNIMSGKMKQRSLQSTGGNITIQSTNERILKECHTLYTDSENGLLQIAKSLGLSLLAPRKKISILLLGNHSAGKSSFINWYVEEQVQKTGVAIETQGFTFITSGRKRESLTGNATLHLYPHFEPLRSITGVVDYLTTEISTSKQKKFSLVTFVDTPGLVDGDMKYPFDVNEAILWLGDMADLIFVFFDPIGQALCKRTLNLVEKLNEKHADIMKFYLSKADEAGHESDRQRVMMQIVQELCKRPGLNRTGFDMPTIYISSLSSKPSRCANQIDEVCREIEKTINQTIQNTLNSLEHDCDQISEIVDRKIDEDNVRRSQNWKANCRWVFYSLLAVMLPLLLLFTFLLSTSHALLSKLLGESLINATALHLEPITNTWKLLPQEYENHARLGIMLLSVIFLLLAKLCSRTTPTLSRQQKRKWNNIHQYVQKTVKTKKQALYQEYLHQSVAEHDP